MNKNKKIFNIISFIFCLLTIALGGFIVGISEAFGNLGDIWPWIVILAFLCSICSVVCFNRKTAYYILDIGFGVLYFLGAMICDTEFIFVGLIFLGASLLSLLFKWLGREIA